MKKFVDKTVTLSQLDSVEMGGRAEMSVAVEGLDKQTLVFPDIHADLELALGYLLGTGLVQLDTDTPWIYIGLDNTPCEPNEEAIKAHKMIPIPHLKSTGANDKNLLFLGDYCDRYQESAEVVATLRHAKSVIESDRKAKMTLLIGDHDLHFLEQKGVSVKGNYSKLSGYFYWDIDNQKGEDESQAERFNFIAELLQTTIAGGQMVFTHTEGNVLFSHSTLRYPELEKAKQYKKDAGTKIVEAENKLKGLLQAFVQKIQEENGQTGKEEQFEKLNSFLAKMEEKGFITHNAKGLQKFIEKNFSKGSQEIAVALEQLGKLKDESSSQLKKMEAAHRESAQTTEAQLNQEIQEVALDPKGLEDPSKYALLRANLSHVGKDFRIWPIDLKSGGSCPIEVHGHNHLARVENTKEGTEMVILDPDASKGFQGACPQHCYRLVNGNKQVETWDVTIADA